MFSRFHGPQTHSPLWTRPSPFHHLQLLPALASARSARARNIFVQILGEVRGHPRMSLMSTFELIRRNLLKVCGRFQNPAYRLGRHFSNML
jgi:hypothetical protein